MKRDLKAFVAPSLAALLLVVMLVQTRAALRASGAWTREGFASHAPATDPYAALDHLLAGGDVSALAPSRDPFSLAPIVTLGPVRPAKPRVVVPPPPPAHPVLTSIVWDNDPRATIRWDGRDYSVRENTLFADFHVLGITREQVLLERGGERIVLTLPKKGE